MPDIGNTTSTAAPLLDGDLLTSTIDFAGDVDWFQITVAPGVDYHINLAGIDGGPTDPILEVFASDGTTLAVTGNLNYGVGNSEYFDFSAAAGTWYVAVSANGSQTGTYALSLYGEDISGTWSATNAELLVGTPITGISRSASDVDDYAVHLDAGHRYLVAVTPNDDVVGSPGTGMPTGIVSVRDASGHQVASQEHTLVYTPTTSGTYYVGAASNGYGGYYNLAVTETTAFVPAPPAATPLSSIDWRAYTAPTEINVFFASSGATVDDQSGSGPFKATGWDATEKAAAMAAFKNYENVANVHFNVVTNIAQADFVLAENPDTGSAISGNLGYWDVGGPSVIYNGVHYLVSGIGIFNSKDESWTHANLAVGAYGYVTLIHELGHGMGLAHPHDRGGGSDVMHGVTKPFGDYGDYNLNQGVYTVMSYNDGWPTAPQVPQRDATTGTYGYGWEGTLMALDIAELQIKYGANMNYRTGDDTYTLRDVNAAGTYYSAIWDAGGTDTIRYVGSKAAVIDLRAATLDYSSTGGGLVSYVKGIYGGFTIANGVVIENASSGSGADKLYGNAAANVLNGGAGDDTFTGGQGMDSIDGGAGAHDTSSYKEKTLGITVALYGTHFVGVHINGAIEDMIKNIENVVGGSGGDTLAGDGLANMLSGNAGNDSISGGAGNDVIAGGTGIDLLAGGANDDVFLFDTTLGPTNVDQIVDFSHADDTLQLDNAVMAALGAVTGALSSALFLAKAIGHAATSVTQRIIYDKHDGSLWYDVDGKSGAHAATEFAVLINKPQNLDYHDFVII